MKHKKFIHHKIGQKHEIKLRNILVIFLSILIGLGSIVVFAGLTIQSSLSNTVQTISRIIISKSSTDYITGNRLYDFNYDGSGKVKLYLPNIDPSINRNGNRATNSGWKFLGIDLSVDGNSGSDLVFIDKDFFYSTGFWGSGIIGSTSGDNLGNHTATGNLNMNGYWISRDGTPQGIKIDYSANVIIGDNTNQFGGQSYGIIVGGRGNQYVSGGQSSVIFGESNTMVGGSGKSRNSILGGASNYLHGLFSTIIGGSNNNILTGEHSIIAGGSYSTSIHPYTFMRNGYNGSNPIMLYSQGTGSRTTKAPGGYFLFTSGTNQGVFIDPNGFIKSSSLAGSGNTCIYADNNGTLISTGCSTFLNNQISGDNLGNHKATQNINLANQRLSPDGTSQGIQFNSLDDKVKISTLGGNGNQCILVDNNGVLSSTGCANLINNYYNGGDNLGNHTATGNLIMSGHRISNDGNNEGIKIDNDGLVSIGTGSGLTAMLNIFSKSEQNPFLIMANAAKQLILGYRTINGNNQFYMNIGKLQTNDVPGFSIEGGRGIGINVDRAEELLDVGGKIRSRYLEGIGNRCLYANSSGTILASGTNCFSGTIFQTGPVGPTGPMGPQGPAGSGFVDNLGNHIATQDLEMNGYRITKNINNEGILIKSDGNIIIGNNSNTISTNVNNSVILGGLSHQIDSDFSIIGGGYLNHIGDGGYSTIGGGSSNYTNQQGATIAGGTYNNANGILSTVGGGSNNNANGEYSTIPGGVFSTATHARSFVRNGGIGTNILYSQGLGTFTTKAPGGYFLFTSGNNQGVFIDKDGFIKSTSLAGYGDTCIYANNNGTLASTGCGAFLNSKISGDNLGNHTATGNLKMAGHRITNDGDDEGIKIDSIGNVGIGISNPLGFKLYVNGSGRFNGDIILGDSTNRKIQVNSTDGTDGKDLTLQAGNGYNSTTTNQDGGDLYLRGGNKNYGGNYGNVNIVDNGGNVSIGTTESLAKTTISGDIIFTKGASRSITLQTEATTKGKDLLISAGNSTVQDVNNLYTNFGGNLILNAGSNTGFGRGGSIYLNPGGPNYDTTTNVYIAGSGGRVAIGTNDLPSEKLDVNGKIRMRNLTQVSDSGDIVVTKSYLGNNEMPPLNLSRRKGRSSNTRATATPLFEELSPSYTCSVDSQKYIENAGGTNNKVFCGYYSKCYITKQKGGTCSIQTNINKQYLVVDPNGNSSCEATCYGATLEDRRMEYIYLNVKKNNTCKQLFINGIRQGEKCDPNGTGRDYNLGNKAGCMVLGGNTGHFVTGATYYGNNYSFSAIMKNPGRNFVTNNITELLSGPITLSITAAGGHPTGQESFDLMCRKYIP